MEVFEHPLLQTKISKVFQPALQNSATLGQRETQHCPNPANDSPQHAPRSDRGNSNHTGTIRHALPQTGDISRALELHHARPWANSPDDKGRDD